MIDLHSHMIAENTAYRDSDAAWENIFNVARMALEDGIDHLVWTPEYRLGQIEDAAIEQNKLTAQLVNVKLKEAGYPLEMSLGADFHVTSRERNAILSEIRKVTDSQYVFLSFSQAYLPTNFETVIQHLLQNGLTPIISHPERLSWINEKYHSLRSLVNDGAWIQLTADSFTGYFGRKAQYWSERFLSEGIIHVIASEAHSVERRPPVLSEAKQILQANLSADEVNKIMVTRPQLILDNAICGESILPPGVVLPWQSEKVS